MLRLELWSGYKYLYHPLREYLRNFSCCFLFRIVSIRFWSSTLDSYRFCRSRQNLVWGGQSTSRAILPVGPSFIHHAPLDELDDTQRQLYIPEKQA